MNNKSIRRFCCLSLTTGVVCVCVTSLGCFEKPRTGAKSDSAKPVPASEIVPFDNRHPELVNAEQAGRFRQREKARAAIDRFMESNPRDYRDVAAAADVAQNVGFPELSSELLIKACDLAEQPDNRLLLSCARALMGAGKVYQSLERLEQLLSAFPDDEKGRAEYAGLAARLGMTHRSAEHLRWLIRRGKGDINELIMLANLNMPQMDVRSCTFAISNNPDDSRPLYPLTLPDAHQGNWESVANDLSPVIETSPDFGVAWALYCRALAELQRDDELIGLQARMPRGAAKWPEYWMAAGLWAERNEKFPEAARAFWNVVRIDNFHGEALNHLAACLSELGNDSEAQKVAKHLAKVNALNDSVEALLTWRRNSQTAALDVSRVMQELGRPWEAEAWAREGLMMSQKLVPTAHATHRRLRSALKSETPWQQKELAITHLVKLDDLPQFAWSKSSPQKERNEAASMKLASEFRFRDVAEHVNLHHTTDIDRSVEGGLAIYQSNAGGASVIDFELDGWPDICLTSVSGSPNERNSAPNQLFRNRDGAFANVTAYCSLNDRGYTQGLTVGDFNADGFPDLVSGNIGENRFYQNNGDGTFLDVTERMGVSGKRWTSSVALADIDSDGLTDYVEINYCGGKDVYTRKCMDAALGQPRSCSPLVFPGEPDRIYRSVGDGTLENVTHKWLGDTQPRHGLGLVVGQIDNVPGTDIYVANDEGPNQLWSLSYAANKKASNKNDARKNDSDQKNQKDPSVRLVDQATIRGVAVDRRSRSQASMGIAFGDADGDGDFDLYVTHFTDDYNTYYQQLRGGTWSDKTASVGLAKPTLAMLAFGTEWMDANNDGDPELIVANGNVDDFQHKGHKLRMPAQFFAKALNADGDHRWIAVNDPTPGEYFQRNLIGRALVTWDFNRDGKQDALVTHIFDPTSILQNETSTQSRCIRIFLKGRGLERDAIGTIVRAKIGETERVAQLSAGDGYQCANERVVTIGLGDAKVVDKLTLQWTDGSTTTIADVPGGADYLIVQGDEEATLLFEHLVPNN